MVFFVGAGFSIDSEKMSSKEILWRLWIRLEALCHVVDQPKGSSTLGKKTWSRFQQTFMRHSKREPRLMKGSPHSGDVPGEIEWMAPKYYEINDWLCDAFGSLVVKASGKTQGRDILGKALEREEETLFTTARGIPLNQSPERKPSSLPDWMMKEARKLGMKRPTHASEVRALGKLVLMATFGFFDDQVLAGVCHGSDEGIEHAEALETHRMVSKMYDRRLLPRHHVLARLAREGFCPTLITTNFDMLLEGALRLSGLEAEPKAHVAQRSGGRALGASLSLQIPYYDVISSPVAFYRRGKAYRTATLLKIHGCAGHARALAGAKEGCPDWEQLKAYLPQVVYTYREIQNWRADHWTADLLRTLLRTRTLVFAGYSTADPVIHDTFRSVYEEMETKSRVVAGATADPSKPAAPAYFLGYSDQEESAEFHAEQVLRSASRAVGQPDHASSHRHYIRFGGRGRDAKRWSLDETLGLVAHQVFRGQQRDALETELAALAARLMGGRQPKDKVARVIQNFDHLMKQEGKALPFGKKVDSPGRRSLERALAWSQGFHASLRREWALALAFGQHEARVGRATALMESMRHPLWYFPASERPAWTAWSAVVELALRNMGKALQRGGGQVEEVQPTHDLLPTVMLPFHDPSSHGTSRARILALTIQLGGFDRLDKKPRVSGQPSLQTVWTFDGDALPWRVHPAGEDDAGQPGGGKPKGRRATVAVNRRLQPSARWIWGWALMDGVEGDGLGSLQEELGIQG